MDKTKYYPVICANCDFKLHAAKSIFHEMGILDRGHATCPDCSQFLNISYDPESDSMTSKKWALYLEEKKREDDQE